MRWPLHYGHVPMILGEAPACLHSVTSCAGVWCGGRATVRSQRLCEPLFSCNILAQQHPEATCLHRASPRLLSLAFSYTCSLWATSPSCTTNLGTTLKKNKMDGSEHQLDAPHGPATRGGMFVAGSGFSRDCEGAAPSNRPFPLVACDQVHCVAVPVSLTP